MAAHSRMVVTLGPSVPLPNLEDVWYTLYAIVLRAIIPNLEVSLLKMGSYSSTMVSILGILLSLLSSTQTILLTCSNSDILLYYSNDTF